MIGFLRFSLLLISIEILKKYNFDMQKSEVKLKQISRILFNKIIYFTSLTWLQKILNLSGDCDEETIKDDHGVEYAGFVHVPQDFAPNNFRICSKESQKVIDHGAILSQHGKNPL